MHENQQRSVVITDYDYDDVGIERAIIEGAGFELVAAQCKTEDDVIGIARDADAVIAQYAHVKAKAIGAFTRCRVIARYGTGVDIVDVDAATRRNILVTRLATPVSEDTAVTAAVALERGIEAAFQLEDSELSCELLPDRVALRADGSFECSIAVAQQDGDEIFIEGRAGIGNG